MSPLVEAIKECGDFVQTSVTSVNVSFNHKMSQSVNFKMSYLHGEAIMFLLRYENLVFKFRGEQQFETVRTSSVCFLYSCLPNTIL